MKELSNFDIIDYYKGDNRFGGVFSRDNLPKKIEKKSYVVNMDTEDQSGTHWVCVHNLTDKCIYFDSFGIDPPPLIIDFMKTSDKQLMNNDKRIQDLKSIACGYFCIYIIDQLNLGRSYISVLLDFDNNLKKNDKIIEDKVEIKGGEVSEPNLVIDRKYFNKLSKFLIDKTNIS